MHTLFGCACIDKALLTESTLNKYGSWPALGNDSATFTPTAAGCSASQDDKSCPAWLGMLLGPFECVPIHS